jgi:medium-chain acyl-[acyl-carrier-protein] hydrolase
MDIGNSWETTIRIQTFQMDTEGKAHILGICNYLQEAASMHAHLAGLGFDQMMRRNQVWVLTRLKVEMAVYPEWNDLLNLKTWSRGNEGIFYLRDFLISNTDGETIVKATSSWAALNLKSRRPELVEGLEELMNSKKQEVVLDGKLQKLPKITQPKLLREYEVQYTDIDIVYHVNNVKYIEMMVNAYPLEKHKNMHIKSLEVNYLGETGYGEKVQVWLDQQSSKKRWRPAQYCKEINQHRSMQSTVFMGLKSMNSNFPLQKLMVLAVELPVAITKFTIPNTKNRLFMVKQQEHPTIFLQKIGKIEFVLFIFSFAGLVLNTLHIKGGKLVMGLGLNAFALLYIFVAIGFRQLQTKNRFDRAVFTFSYLALSVLIIGIMFGILGVRGINLLTNGGMLLVLFLIFRHSDTQNSHGQHQQQHNLPPVSIGNILDDCPYGALHHSRAGFMKPVHKLYLQYGKTHI